MIESLKPIAVHWNSLQAYFMQYSRIGSDREQGFHAWRLFQFDENSETIGSYVSCITQVMALFGYGEPQVLEVCKNTILSRLYWLLFPIEDLRWAVQTAKRNIIKEKLGRWEGFSFCLLTLYMTQRIGFSTKQNKLLVNHKLSPSHQHWLHQVWWKMFFPATWWYCCGNLFLIIILLSPVMVWVDYYVKVLRCTWNPFASWQWNSQVYYL